MFLPTRKLLILLALPVPLLAVFLGLLAIGLLLGGSPLESLWLPPWSALLSPLTFPAAAAYGLQGWGWGLLVAAAWAGLGCAALWLASDDARYVTGQELKVDAGLMLK